jgi:hypothetical protein
MSRRRFARLGDSKFCFQRHRRISGKTVDRLDRSVETAVRQDAQRDIAEQVEDMDPRQKEAGA